MTPNTAKICLKIANDKANVNGAIQKNRYSSTGETQCHTVMMYAFTVIL